MTVKSLTNVWAWGGRRCLALTYTMALCVWRNRWAAMARWKEAHTSLTCGTIWPPTTPEEMENHKIKSDCTTLHKASSRKLFSEEAIIETRSRKCSSSLVTTRNLTMLSLQIFSSLEKALLEAGKAEGTVPMLEQWRWEGESMRITTPGKVLYGSTSWHACTLRKVAELKSSCSLQWIMTTTLKHHSNHTTRCRFMSSLYIILYYA